ncbi:MAG: hypothetical protein JW395_0361 [Nitrospira sp.]|nr:hypothetical protein [Nitrospira sp.]
MTGTFTACFSRCRRDLSPLFATYRNFLSPKNLSAASSISSMALRPSAMVLFFKYFEYVRSSSKYFTVTLEPSSCLVKRSRSRKYPPLVNFTW